MKSLEFYVLIIIACLAVVYFAQRENYNELKEELAELRSSASQKNAIPKSDSIEIKQSHWNGDQIIYDVVTWWGHEYHIIHDSWDEDLNIYHWGNRCVACKKHGHEINVEMPPIENDKRFVTLIRGRPIEKIHFIGGDTIAEPIHGSALKPIK